MRSGVVAAVLMTRGFLYIISKFTIFLRFLCVQARQRLGKQVFYVR